MVLELGRTSATSCRLELYLGADHESHKALLELRGRTPHECLTPMRDLASVQKFCAKKPSSRTREKSACCVDLTNHVVKASVSREDGCWCHKGWFWGAVT